MKKPDKELSELDKKIQEIHARYLKSLGDTSLLKNLIDHSEFEESFIEQNKNEILNRLKN